MLCSWAGRDNLESLRHHFRSHPDLARRCRQPWAELPHRVTAGALALAPVGHRRDVRHHHRVAGLCRADHVRFECADPSLRLAGDAVRIVGGAYLVWLGIQAWRAQPHDLQPAAAAGTGQGGPSLLHGLRVGFLTEITNPKGIAFFLGLFAAAVPAATPLWAKLAVLSAGGVIEVAWYTAVSFALSSGPMRAGYQRVRRTVDRVLGTLLIALGLKVALDAR